MNFNKKYYFLRPFYNGHLVFENEVRTYDFDNDKANCCNFNPATDRLESKNGTLAKLYPKEKLHKSKLDFNLKTKAEIRQMLQ